MLRLVKSITVFLAIFVSAPVEAEECLSFSKYLDEGIRLDGTYFDSFTFQKESRGNIILLMFKDGPSGKVQKWKLFRRYGDDLDTFCLLGEGTDFELLEDLSDNSSADRFGMPGSGNPRCSAHNQVLPGSLAVRMWANRELGPSTIMYLDAAEGSDFQFLMAKDGPWIILETLPDQRLTTCYYERGEASIWKAYQTN